MKIENIPIQKIYRLVINKNKPGLRMECVHFPIGSH
jgi:hypothetical protein